MLSSLRISNYALIRDIRISFSGGLSVITGETGAGKSILLGALGLVLGNRAEGDVLLDKEKKCYVEASFDLRNYMLKAFFTQNDIDFDDECILRREISPGGKSRSFINDTPCSLELMRELASNLVEIHSQHATVSLFRPAVQLSILDNWCLCSDDVEAYGDLYSTYRSKVENLNELSQRQKEQSLAQEYLHFQYDEIQKANLKESEKEEIIEELQVLEHAEEISQILALLLGYLEGTDSENNFEVQLNQIVAASRRLEILSSRFKSSAESMYAIRAELQDLARFYAGESGAIEANPLRLNELRSRLDLIQHLENKHGVNGCTELIGKKDSFSIQLQEYQDLSEQIQALKEEIDDLKARINEEAGRLSGIRRAGAITLSKAIMATLTELNLDKASFEVGFETLDNPGFSGKERVKFLFSANANSGLGDMAKIASGGELSRVMLALKANISEKRLLPTIVFDEIDNGISGETASRVGRMMRKLAEQMQVISITHQPSIAGYGQVHFLVEKIMKGEEVITIIEELTDNERVNVLASMISGGRKTDASLEAARELLSH